MSSRLSASSSPSSRAIARCGPARHARPSPACLSHSTHQPSVAAPGPGAYLGYDGGDLYVLQHASLPGANPNSNLVSKVGRGGRFTGDGVVSPAYATGPNVGPGSYSPAMNNDGVLSTIDGRVKAVTSLGEDASFTSARQRELNMFFLDEMEC